MLEMFILNPGRKTRDKPSRTRRRLRRLLRSMKKNKNKRKRHRMAGRKVTLRLGRFKDNSSRKKMAKTKKHKRSRRRSYRRNPWKGDKFGHRWAGRLKWAYSPKRKTAGKSGRRRHRRGYPSKQSVKNYIRSYGFSGLAMYRRGYPAWPKGHKVSRRRKSRRRMVSFRPRRGVFKHMTIAANRKRRRTVRNGRGQFVSRRRKSRRYRDNWFVLNPKRRRKSSRRRRSRKYADNWFVLNKPRRRRGGRRRAHGRRRQRRSARRYRDNSPGGLMAGMIAHVKGIFNAEFMLETVLPVAGGFFASRAVTGAISGLTGMKFDGITKVIANLVGAGLAGWAVGFLTKQPHLAMNITLGGVANVAVDFLRGVSKDVAFIKQSPLLSEAFGVSGFGLGTDEDVRKAVEAEVMRELGVGDFLSAEQLGRAERVSGLGTFLTSENMAVAERISGMGQYPRETQGMAQYPAETSGMADLSDVSDLAVIG